MVRWYYNTEGSFLILKEQWGEGTVNDWVMGRGETSFWEVLPTEMTETKEWRLKENLGNVRP